MLLALMRGAVMQKFFMLGWVLLALTGCFTVGSFGEYWAQAKLDAALTGRWQSEDCRWLSITERYGAHNIERNYDHLGAFYPSKSVMFGNNHYLLYATGLDNNYKWYHYILEATNSVSGYMWRYEFKDEWLTYYKLKREALVLLPKPPPTVGWEEYANPASWLLFGHVDRSMAVYITRLDAETVQWLASLPDGDKFWDVEGRYRQVPMQPTTSCSRHE